MKKGWNLKPVVAVDVAVVVVVVVAVDVAAVVVVVVAVEKQVFAQRG